MTAMTVTQIRKLIKSAESEDDLTKARNLTKMIRKARRTQEQC